MSVIPGSPALLERTRRNLRSVLMSEKLGVPLELLARDYRQLVGEDLPWTGLGFPTLQELLDSLPDVCSLEWRGNQQTVVSGGC